MTVCKTCETYDLLLNSRVSPVFVKKSPTHSTMQYLILAFCPFQSAFHLQKMPLWPPEASANHILLPKHPNHPASWRHNDGLSGHIEFFSGFQHIKIKFNNLENNLAKVSHELYANLKWLVVSDDFGDKVLCIPSAASTRVVKLDASIGRANCRCCWFLVVGGCCWLGSWLL